MLFEVVISLALRNNNINQVKYLSDLVDVFFCSFAEL